MGPTSKDLLHLERDDYASPLETKLLLSNRTTNVSHGERGTPHGKMSAKLITTRVPESSVLKKLKDFLPIMDEANCKLHVELQETIKDHDIEVLRGDDEQYIEMDLALGVAELHTPEALAAAESAMTGQWQILPVSAIKDDGDSSWATDGEVVDNNDDNDGSVSSQMSRRETSAICRKGCKRPRIEELQ